MKKGILYILLLTALHVVTGCSDFLSEENKVDIEKEGFLTTTEQAETVLFGIYQTTTADALYGYYLSFYFSMGTDCEQAEGNTTNNWRLLPSNAYPTTQSEVQQAWQYLYIGIYRANDFLERISAVYDSFEEKDKQLITVYMAEARALRGLFYFELVRRFGNIPLITTTAMSYMDPREATQEDPAKVYEYIEADLKYAMENLPWATEDSYRTDNSFRFSKGAAMGLLSKVYATWAGWPVKDTSKWELAAKTAGELIMSGKHDLLPEFEQLWDNTCNGTWDPTESLIEISFYSPTYKGSSDPSGRIGKWNGVKTTAIAGKRGSCAGNEKVVYSFVLDWRAEDGVGVEKNGDKESDYIYHPDGTNPDGLVDKRRDLSIANYRYDDGTGDGPIFWAAERTNNVYDPEKSEKSDLDPDKRQKEKQNYTPAKWDIEKYVETGYLLNNDQSNVNWYVLRYADVLLIYAEALNEWKNGPTNEAYSAVNKVRRRAYGVADTSHDLKTGMDVEEFRQAVRKERKYELAFEGHRRLDLVRWDVYYETVMQTRKDQDEWWGASANYVVAEYTRKGHHELMPIPQREMDLCTKFEQNPGWK